MFNYMKGFLFGEDAGDSGMELIQFAIIIVITAILIAVIWPIVTRSSSAIESAGSQIQTALDTAGAGGSGDD